jgi:hypothetical protein
MLIQKDNISLNGFGLFDALVYHRQAAPIVANAELQVILRIYLEPVNEGKKVIGDGEKGHKFKVDNWPGEVWRNFKEAYVNTGVAFWDQKFWLKTPDTYAGFNYDAGHSDTRMDIETVRECRFWGTSCKEVPHFVPREEWKKQMVRPNIDCRFKIFLVDTKYSDFTSIRVNYITHKLHGKKWIPIGNSKLTGFRSDSTTYSQSDILEEKMYYKGTALKFQTILHELGHTMGLEHAAFVRGEDACIKMVRKKGDEGKNAAACYASSHSSASDVMGIGKALSEHDSLAWKVAAETLTGVRREDWRVSTLRLYPDLI